MPSRLSRVFPNSVGGTSTGATVGFDGLLEGDEGLEGVVGVVGVVGLAGVVEVGGAGFRGLSRSGILNFIHSYSLADMGHRRLPEHISKTRTNWMWGIGAYGQLYAVVGRFVTIRPYRAFSIGMRLLTRPNPGGRFLGKMRLKARFICFLSMVLAVHEELMGGAVHE